MERDDSISGSNLRRQFLEPPEELNLLARHVLQAAIEVHRCLGPGFMETVYEEALALELRACGIPHQRQVRFPVLYKERIVGESRLDFLIDERLVVELKAVDELHEVHTQQLFSYLRAGEFQLGLVINFNVAVLLRGVRRRVWSG